MRDERVIPTPENEEKEGVPLRRYRLGGTGSMLGGVTTKLPSNMSFDPPPSQFALTRLNHPIINYIKFFYFSIYLEKAGARRECAGGIDKLLLIDPLVPVEYVRRENSTPF